MMVLALGMLVGCKSKQDAAIDTAKKQAAATGQAQQVVSTDKGKCDDDDALEPPAPGRTDTGRDDNGDAGGRGAWAGDYGSG